LKMKKALLWLFLAATSCQGRVTPQSTITPAEARQYIGKAMTVCGNVRGVENSSAANGQPTVLKLGRRSLFSIVIPGSSRKKFGNPEADYLDKRICVTGTISEDASRTPQIEAKTPEQIRAQK
jgi:hypothetical protein